MQVKRKWHKPQVLEIYEVFSNKCLKNHLPITQAVLKLN